MGDRYKLITKGGKAQLFDIPTDPAEKENLVDEQPAVLERMEKELMEWTEEVMTQLKAVEE